MSKKVSKEEKANYYLKELKEVFNYKEMSYITTIFSVIKRSVGEDYYFDVINACCEKLLESKKIGTVFEPADTVREIYSETGFTRNNVIPIQKLTNEERLYSPDKDLYIEIMKNRIFTDVLNGKNKTIIAERYGLSEEAIEEIYTEKLALATVENKEKKKKNIK